MPTTTFQLFPCSCYSSTSLRSFQLTISNCGFALAVPHWPRPSNVALLLLLLHNLSGIRFYLLRWSLTSLHGWHHALSAKPFNISIDDASNAIMQRPAGSVDSAQL